MQGCAFSENAHPVVKKTLLQKSQSNMICKNLQRPEFISFKQLAFAVGKKEHLHIGNINDFYFYDKKFKSKWFSSIPEVKLNLESKHNAVINVLNYPMKNRAINILALNKSENNWFTNAKNQSMSIEAGKYTVKAMYKNIKDLVDIKINQDFYNVPILIKKKLNNTSVLNIINIMTLAISKQYNYSFDFEDNKLMVYNLTSSLDVKNKFIKPFVSMLKQKNIFYSKNGNAFLIKDSFYKYWFAKKYLKSLNLSEDRFSFCVNLNHHDLYGTFTSNDKIVLRDIGKIELINYGQVKNGKLKYKLKIEENGRKSPDEYIIYGNKDTFSTQLSNNAVLKIKLY